MGTSFGVTMDIDDTDSVKSALALIAKGLMDYYEGWNYGGTVGMMVSPYYWWEAGAAWGSMLDYWYYSGNDTYNDVIKQSLLYQAGSGYDFMPQNQTTTEGNDDQGFWGITVMAAAEKNFSNPTGKDEKSWAYLAQAVFNTMKARWDDKNCDGGLRWQIYTWNSGYDYKNSVSNGCLFHLAARLARYTGNSSYVEWGEKVWNWTSTVGFLTSDYQLYDGASIESDCKTYSTSQWTYNAGLYLSGCAYLYNYTNDTVWLDRATSLWDHAKTQFFSDDIMYESACQPSGKCNNDERCFKAIFSRFLGLTALLAPDLNDEIMALLQSSAQAAATSCSGGTDGHTCGLNWQKDGWDGMYGLGEQMSALEVIQNTLIHTKQGPLTERTGATSKGDADAGTSETSASLISNHLTITGKDRAGAGILTTVCVILLLGVGWWMLR